MKVGLSGTGVLALAGVAVAGYLGWKAYKTGGKLFAGLKEGVDQAAAEVQSAWINNVSGPFARGQAYARGEADPLPVSTKAWLYSDYQYTGIDPATGQLVTDGEWYGNAEARRYEAQQATAPAATSNNGAAFGIYPKP